MSLNVKRALEVVKKFEMVWPDKQGNDAAFQLPPTGKKESLDASRGNFFNKATTGDR